MRERNRTFGGGEFLVGARLRLFLIVASGIVTLGVAENSLARDDLARRTNKPNIVLIISDDAGYADFGFQGSEKFKTPNLDGLAADGVRFSQAYVTAAVCGPSRAGLFTGRYQQRFGFEENNVPGYMKNYGLPDDEMGLPLKETTIAGHLKKQGYRTGLFGKWHQGNADRFHPLNRGFDEFAGFRGGARSYFELTKAQQVDRPENRFERGHGKYEEPTQYLTDVLADETSGFIRRNHNVPFFAVLSFNAVHNPMQADKKDLKRFPDLQGKRKTLAAMTLSMDRACGRVFDTIEELSLAENTIVVFVNDNGGPSDANHSDNSPLSGSKANHLEGGIRVPMLVRWPNKTKPGATFDLPVSTLDLLPTFYAAANGQVSDLKNIDGVDLAPHLNSRATSRPHQTLFWKKESRGAVRDGDWKLLRFPDRPAELYNLADDIAEKNNLATKYPERVKAMYRQLFQWELTLVRPRWQLQRKFEGAAMKRMDRFKK